MAYGSLTRAQLRDAVRRELSQIPPIDDGTGAAGVAPTRNPFPINALVNAKLDEAVAYFSRKCRIAGDATPRSLPIPAQTATGPYAIDLQRLAPFGHANDVLSAWWVESGGTTGSPLTPDHRDNRTRDRADWPHTGVGTPERYWVDRGKLLIEPAPSAEGTLKVMLGTALWIQATTVDQETIEIIPSDYLPIVAAEAARLVCMTQIEDEEMQNKIPALTAKVVDGLGDMREFFARRNRGYQARVVPDVGRISYGAGRR